MYCVIRASAPSLYNVYRRYDILLHFLQEQNGKEMSNKHYGILIGDFSWQFWHCGYSVVSWWQHSTHRWDHTLHYSRAFQWAQSRQYPLSKHLPQVNTEVFTFTKILIYDVLVTDHKVYYFVCMRRTYNAWPNPCSLRV